MDRWHIAGWSWWTLMLIVSLANLVILTMALRRPESPETKRRLPAGERKAMRAAAVIFTLVCAYRAILPRIDVPRTCFIDSFLSWALFGRICACCAEVAWATQMGLAVRRVGLIHFDGGKLSASAKQWASSTGIAVITMACIAECCSWTNLITENNFFGVIEQALWGGLFCATGVALALMLRLWPQAPRPYILFTCLVLVMGLEQFYEAFGLYLPRFLSDQADHVQYMNFLPGLRNLAECATTTQDIRDWSGDAPWMTGYFSFGVWSSIYLAVAPLPCHSTHPDAFIP